MSASVVTRSNASRELSRLLAVVLAVVTITVLYLAKTVVLPLAFAVLFAFLLAPLVTLLERIRVPRILAILVVILIPGAILGAIGWGVSTQLFEVTSHLPAYKANINRKIETLNRSKSGSFTRAEQEVDRLSQKIGTLDSDSTPNGQQSGAKELGSSPDRPVSVREVGQNHGRLGAVQGVLGALVSILLVVVFTFFMLLQREDLRNRFIRLTGRGHLNLMTQAMDEAGNRVTRYLSLLLLVNTCYGLIIFTALHFIGLPHALLWGALAGILRFIPYIGAPVAGLLPTAFSLAVFSGWTHALLILAIFFCLEIVTANFIEPRIYGKHTGLSPLAILVAAVFWALIWGPIGLLLSVPLTVCLVVVGGHVPTLKFLTVLLGDQPVMRPEAHYYQRLLSGDDREAGEVLETYLKDKSLEELYDLVVIPALSLSEQDRHRNAIDDATVEFITQTTKDLVEELALSSEAEKRPDAIAEASSNGDAALTAGIPIPRASAPKRVACVPVRDDADEIVAIMLTQLLERAGYSAKAIPLGNVEATLAAVSKDEPDLICLSGLPPYATSYSRAAYKSLRALRPQREIIIGLWNYTGDPGKAASEISSGKENHICTTLAQAILAAGQTFPAALAQTGAGTDSLITQA